MSGAAFERIAIVGLGLLGASIALAVRERGVARSIVAAGRRRRPLEEALARGVVDEVGDIDQVVRGADLVLLGTPVSAMPRVLEQAAPHLAGGALVSDVGSVKSMLAETLPGLLPAGVHYVGSHPMAGSHLRGAEHARADLFEGATCAVTPHEGSSQAACDRISAFWRALGATVVLRDPLAHDVEVAWTSHAPHLLAFAFAGSLKSAPQGTGALAGAGFRDFTRIAGSDAELWGDILSANRKQLAGPLHAFGEALSKLARILEEGDAEGLERSLASAREALAAVVHRTTDASHSGDAFDARSGGDNPEIKATQCGGHRGKQ